MKPKNKKQQRILKLSATLPALTAKQKSFAYDKCIDKVGYLNKGQITCVGCNTIFSHDNNMKKYTICPGCGDKIEIEKTRKKRFKFQNYFSIITTRKEYQVVRYFYCWYAGISGKDNYSRKTIFEAFQLWFTEDFKTVELIALNRNFMGYVPVDAWIWGSKMEIRDSSPYQLIGINAVVWPNTRVLPLFRRNGFKSSTHGAPPAWLLRTLARNHQYETIFKAGYYKLLDVFDYNVNKHWASIKIAIRNKYKIKDASMYIDYLDMLLMNNKDMHNPVYVCPRNLKKEHDKLLAIQRKKQEVERLRRERLNQIEREKRMLLNAKYLAEAEERYKKKKSRFFDIQFSSGGITVKVLDSIQEFSKEGDTLNHCVYTNRYYDNDKSLILSARIGDQILETIEISLEIFKILQCRGLRNQNSEYHDKIVSLVKQNIHQIIKKAS